MIFKKKGVEKEPKDKNDAKNRPARRLAYFVKKIQELISRDQMLQLNNIT